VPHVSVTITPTGYAYQLAREIIGALHRTCPAPTCVDFEPHVTLQLVRGAPSAKVVAAALEPAARRTAPFEIKFATIGSFDDPPSVHVNLAPSDGLLRLYLAIKLDLDQLGLNTYEYDAQSWQPHLTLSCRHWSTDDVAYIRGMFTRLEVSFLADRLMVNELEGELATGTWRVEQVLRLEGDAADEAGLAA
jgi:2'-5' RNA ligase